MIDAWVTSLPGERKHLFTIFSSYAPITERLEEASLFLVTHVSIIFRPQSFLGRE